jgi:hypothetical protein
MGDTNFIGTTPVFSQEPVDIRRWEKSGNDLINAETTEQQQIAYRLGEWLTQMYDGKEMVIRIVTERNIPKHEGKGFVMLTPGAIRDKEGKPVWDDSFRTRFRLTERNGAVAWNSMYIMYRPKELRSKAQELLAARSHRNLKQRLETQGTDAGSVNQGGKLEQVKVPIVKEPDPQHDQAKRGPGGPRKI